MSVTSSSLIGKVTGQDCIFEVSGYAEIDQYFDFEIGLHIYPDFTANPVVGSNNNLIAFGRHGASNRNALQYSFRNASGNHTRTESSISINFSDDLDAPSQNRLSFYFTFIVNRSHNSAKITLITDSDEEITELTSLDINNFTLGFFAAIENESYTDSSSDTKYGRGIIDIFYYSIIKEEPKNLAIQSYTQLYDEDIFPLI